MPPTGPQLTLGMHMDMEAHLKQMQKLQMARRMPCNATVDLASTIARELLNEAIAEATTPFAARLQRKPLLKEELFNVVVRQTLNSIAVELEELLSKKPDIDTGCADIYSLIDDKAPDIIEAALERRGGAYVNSETGSILTRIFEDKKERVDHYETLAKGRVGKFRPLELKHMPLVEQIYEPFVLTPDAILKMATGKETEQWRTFLESCRKKDHEWDTMTAMLERTRWLSGRKTKAQRHAHETMYGMGMWSPVADELLGLSVHTVAPLNPANDTEYKTKQESIRDHGISGGKITYSQITPDKLHGMMMSPLHAKLFLIIGKVVGAATEVFASNIAQMRPSAMLTHLEDLDLDVKLRYQHDFLDANTSFSTYYAGGIHIEREDTDGTFESVTTHPILPGQNIGSETFLKKFGYWGHVAHDENAKNYREFMVCIVKKIDTFKEKFRAWMRWCQLIAEMPQVTRKTKNEVSKLLAA